MGASVTCKNEKKRRLHLTHARVTSRGERGRAGMIPAAGPVEHAFVEPAFLEGWSACGAGCGEARAARRHQNWSDARRERCLPRVREGVLRGTPRAFQGAGGRAPGDALLDGLQPLVHLEHGAVLAVVLALLAAALRGRGGGAVLRKAPWIQIGRCAAGRACLSAAFSVKSTPTSTSCGSVMYSTVRSCASPAPRRPCLSR